MLPTISRFRSPAYGGFRVVLAAIAATAMVAAGTTPAAAIPAGPHSPSTPDWVVAWTGSAVAGSSGTGNSCPAGAGLSNQTVRNAIYLSAGGEGIRVRLTNAFGTRPLTVGRASVAIQQRGATPKAGSLRELTFGGEAGVTIPAGGHRYSDYADLSVGPLMTLLVSVHVPDSTGPVTNHPFTTNTNFLAPGDKALATTASSFATTPCWLMVDAVDVDDDGPGQWVGGSIVALGDSITDTANTMGDANHRWTDLAAGRYALLSSSPMMSIVNAGLGGNRLLADRPGQPYYGVAALSRLERDVFSQSGITSLIVLLGTNDLGYGASADDIVTGYKEIISRSKARGLRVFGGTIPPMGGSGIWSVDKEATWNTVNTWIRGGGSFDGVIDFAAALADPADPARMAAAYDSGDHLHPNDAGTAAMARVVPLRELIDTTRPRR